MSDLFLGPLVGSVALAARALTPDELGSRCVALHQGGYLPAAIIDTNRRPAAGVQVREDRIQADEVEVIGRVDGGAQSPRETWLRPLLVGAGFPRPQTQIAVRNEWGWAEAYLGMGWEDILVAGGS